MAVGEAFRIGGRQWRAHGLGVIQVDQFATLAFEIRHTHFSQRLEGTTEAGSRSPRMRRNAPFLATIARQKDDDAVSFRKLVCAKDERVCGVKRHYAAFILPFDPPPLM